MFIKYEGMISFRSTAFRGNGDIAIELKYAVKVSIMIQFVQLLIIDFQVK